MIQERETTSTPPISGLVKGRRLDTRSRNTVTNKYVPVSGVLEVVSLDGTAGNEYVVHQASRVPLGTRSLKFSYHVGYEVMRQITLSDNAPIIRAISEYKKLEDRLENGHMDDVMDDLLDTLDKALVNNDFQFVNDFINVIESGVLRVRVLIGVLTLTKPFKDKLPNRIQLYSEYSSRINGSFSQKEASQLLVGLK